MPKSNRSLTSLRRICLSLPDTEETETWGKPHFRVANKIFAGFGEEDGRPVIGFKLEMDHAREIIKITGFWKAPYVGHKGWVSMDASDITDWEMVRELIQESYRLIAPKRSSAKLATSSPSPTKTAKRKKTSPTKARNPAKNPSRKKKAK